MLLSTFIVGAAALFAVIGAGTAAATVLCSETHTPCETATKFPAGTVLDFSLDPASSATLTNTAGEGIDTCTGSTIKGKISNEGGATATVTGPVEELTWTNCQFPTTTTRVGEFEIHHISGTSNGTVTADSEFRVTINTVLFGSCIYGVTAGTDLGTFTEGKTGTASPPIFDTNAVVEKLSGSNLACPATAKWVAKYRLTEPFNFTVSVEPS